MLCFFVTCDETTLEYELSFFLMIYFYSSSSLSHIFILIVMVVGVDCTGRLFIYQVVSVNGTCEIKNQLR